MPPERILIHNPQLARIISTLMEHRGLSSADVAKELRLDTRTVQRAKEGYAKWSTERQIRDFLEGDADQRSADDLKALKSFSKEFLALPPSIVDIHAPTPYDAEPEWNTSEAILAISHREMRSLWTNNLYFWNYEAKQVRYLRQEGADIRRIVLVGGEQSLALERQKVVVLARHGKLRIPTRVFPRQCWGRVVKELGILCHMFVVQGRKCVSFSRYPYEYETSSEPQIVDAYDKQLVSHATDVFNRLWEHESHEPGWWTGMLDLSTPERRRLNQLASRQAKRIERIAEQI